MSSVPEEVINDHENEIIRNPKTRLDIVREWISTECESMPYHYDIEVAKSTYEIEKKDSTSSLDEKMDKIDFTSPSSCGTVDSDIEYDNKDRQPNKVHTKIVKRSSKKKSSYTFLLKNYYIKFGDIDRKSKKKGKESQKRLSNIAAPVRKMNSVLGHV